MVRNYARKTHANKEWKKNIKTAVEAVTSKQMTLRMAETTYGISKSTLSRYVSQGRIPTNGGRFCAVFTEELESLLQSYMMDLSNRFIGFSTPDLRKFAYDFAVANNCSFPESWNIRKSAGKDWLSGFITRNPAVSLRQPEATSIARAAGFNQVVVDKLFDLLRELFTKFHFTSSQIYNVDETGVSTTQKPRKVFAAKGQKQVGKIVSQERGKNVTAVCCMGAAGQYVPPMLIFPRIRAKPSLIAKAPADTIAAYQANGWMSSDIFLQWLKHFVAFVRPSKTAPVLLLLDNHSSHLQLETLNFAKDNYVEMLSFPPHCSHKLQPLDRTVYGPLKNFYNQACDDWMSVNPGKAITEFEVAELFQVAYARAGTVRNAIQGFKVTGIWPFNSQIFEDEEFAPAKTTERPLEIEIINLDMPIQGKTLVFRPSIIRIINNKKYLQWPVQVHLLRLVSVRAHLLRLVSVGGHQLLGFTETGADLLMWRV